MDSACNRFRDGANLMAMLLGAAFGAGWAIAPGAELPRAPAGFTVEMAAGPPEVVFGEATAGSAVNAEIPWEGVR